MNVNEAFRLLKQGARKGCALSTINAVKSLIEGIGVKRSESEAVIFVQKKPGPGTSSAKQYLADSYRRGILLNKMRRKQLSCIISQPSTTHDLFRPWPKLLK